MSVNICTLVSFPQILENSNGNSYLTYTIRLMDQIDQSISSSIKIPLMNQTLYHLTVTIATRYITLDLSGGSSSGSSMEGWGSNPVSLFAEEPQTAISIGGGFLDAPVTRNTGYFTGCISRVSIDDIEFPLNGLLSTSTNEGGFEVVNIGGVEKFCNLCGLASCPNNTDCTSDIYGEVSCQCSAPRVLGNGTCVTPSSMSVPEDSPLGLKKTTFIIIAASVGSAVVLLGVVVISMIVMLRKREVKMKGRLYSINQSHSTSKTRPSNNYTANILKQRTSLTSSLNPSESHERRSGISIFQEHAEERDLENSSSLPHVRHKLCMSVETGIKMDTDMCICGRGILQMENSGCHDVNSTDSARTYESDEIAGSNYNDRFQTRPSISLKTRKHSSSIPDKRTPHTPRSPKEQKAIVPLCPPNISLSQSEYDDEEEETTDMEMEPFNTRVSSSSGMGGSMQNHSRGSDSSENSKMSGCSTPQWYHNNTMSDIEREKFGLQTTQLYYPQPHLANMRPYPPGKLPPPMYHSPPTFSKHMDRSCSTRARSRSIHGGTPSSATTSTVGTDPTKVPRSYPQQYTVGGGERSNGLIYDQRGKEMDYKGHPYHARQLSDPKIVDDFEYTPSSVFVRQYSDPKIPRNGTYCIPRKHTDPWPVFSHQISDPQESSQQTQDSVILPRAAHSTRHMHSSNNTSSRRAPGGEHRQYYTAGCMGPGYLRSAANQKAAHSFRDAAVDEPYHTLNSLSRIDPISNWDAQERMKIAIDHMDPCHLLSGPCIPFEYVSTDPSVVESQTTTDEHHVFQSQGGREGIAEMLNPLDINIMRLREDEMDSILTNSEIGQQTMNHFPSADCSSQYTTTLVAGSNSTSGESTPKLQKVFVLPSSQQSYDV